MASRKDRLKKLVAVQEQLKAFHETRHAGFLAQASAAKAEATEIGRRFDAEGSLSSVFPDLYHRHVSYALTRQEENVELARAEVALIATATARTNMVERAYRDAARQEEREAADLERLEIIGRSSTAPK